MHVYGWRMFMAGACLWPARVYGWHNYVTTRICLRQQYLLPAYVHGRRMFTAGVCLRLAYVYGRHMFMAGVCLWPAYVFVRTLHGYNEKSLIKILYTTK